MKNLFLFLCFFVFVGFLFIYFFKSKKCITSDTLNVEKEIIGNDLTKIFLNLSSKKDFLLFLDSNKNISKTFFEVIERNNNNNLNQQKTDELYLLLSNQYYDSVYSSLQKDFPDISKIFDEINLAIHNFNKESQIKKNPVVNILISGFYNDIVVTHDTINIGIDYFLQLNNKYKPRDLPTYILKRYTPQFLIPTILISYFSQFNLMNINDESLLNEMIAFGKLYYVISKLIPCIDENIILGYDKEEWEILEKTEAFVYSYFIQNELFFEKNHLIKNKYINERPNVFEISPNHPGRIARWLGWKIVKSYIKSNPKTTLEELLYNKDYLKMFYNSNYKPF